MDGERGCGRERGRYIHELEYEHEHGHVNAVVVCMDMEGIGGAVWWWKCIYMCVCVFI